MESKFYEEDKLLVFKITEEIDDDSVQKIRRKADYEIERYMPKRVVFDFNTDKWEKGTGETLYINPNNVFITSQEDVNNIYEIVNNLKFYTFISPYLFTFIVQPKVSSTLPHWIPVIVSYSFWLTSPISLPLIIITSSL